MGSLSARFFDYIQEADFYRDLHREAVALLPAGAGQTWFDIGCGPGLVARLAHARGYDAVGFDLDADVTRLARKRSTAAQGVRYVESGLHGLVGAPWSGRSRFGRVVAGRVTRPARRACPTARCSHAGRYAARGGDKPDDVVSACWFSTFELCIGATRLGPAVVGAHSPRWRRSGCRTAVPTGMHRTVSRPAGRTRECVARAP